MVNDNYELISTRDGNSFRHRYLGVRNVNAGSEVIMHDFGFTDPIAEVTLSYHEQIMRRFPSISEMRTGFTSPRRHN